MRRLLLACVAALTLGILRAEEEVTVETPSAKEVATLSAQDFLKEIRKPLRVDAWGEFTGMLTHKSKDGTRKGTLRVRLTFTPDSMHTQVTLNEGKENANIYAMEQIHKEGQNTKMTIERPEKEMPPGLFSFGIDPEDLTFSFLYWDFLEELPRQSSRLRECRVMRLKEPGGTGTVNVWFHAKHGFPMEAWWFREGQEKPWRKLELKGAKRHANGLWFVKEMRLEGLDWKTQVRFDHVELNPVGE